MGARSGTHGIERGNRRSPPQMGVADGNSKAAEYRDRRCHGYPGKLEAGTVGMVACRGGDHDRRLVFLRRGASLIRRRDRTHVAGPLKEKIYFAREERNAAT